MDLGFSTFYLNRCNRSGVLSAGVIGGLQQRGRWRIDARFPRNELIRRVEAIADYRDAILPSNQDAEAFMRGKLRQLSESRTLVYCDPPYFERSQRLYPHSYDRADHERLAETIQTEVEHHWLVSYDGTPELMALYEARQMFVYSLQYSATRAYKGDEVFIFSDSLAIPSSSSHSSVNKGLLAAFG
jgi:DNA adenine methylase